jgi:hypothetical protein
MLKQGRMSKVAANGYLNSIKGQGSVTQVAHQMKSCRMKGGKL